MEVPVASAATSSISGTVSDSVTKSPIEGVEVCARLDPYENEGGCDTTDSSGNYQIDDLEPNVYGIRFETQFLGTNGLDWAPAHQPVVIGSDPITIDQELKRYGRIEGTVTESGTGEPIENAWVCAFGYDKDFDTNNSCDYTDEDGSYLITGLRKSGDYRVRFVPHFPNGLLAQWYDLKEYEQSDTPDPVPVELADTTTGINAELFPGARVEGTVRSADTGQPFQNVWICAREEHGWAWACGAPKPDGRYKLIGLPADDYLIEFFPGSVGSRPSTGTTRQVPMKQIYFPWPGTPRLPPSTRACRRSPVRQSPVHQSHRRHSFSPSSQRSHLRRCPRRRRRCLVIAERAFTASARMGGCDACAACEGVTTLTPLRGQAEVPTALSTLGKATRCGCTKDGRRLCGYGTCEGTLSIF